jgi:hypothetical protein
VANLRFKGKKERKNRPDIFQLGSPESQRPLPGTAFIFCEFPCSGISEFKLEALGWIELVCKESTWKRLDGNFGNFGSRDWNSRKTCCARAHGSKMSEIQKKFSAGSTKLVLDILCDSVKLLGDPPGGFSPLFLGSSSRHDRLPFSDIELALLYSANSENLVSLRIYLFLVMSVFEFSIVNLREPRGFRIDSSENLLLIPHILIGTIDEIYESNVEIPWTTSPGFMKTWSEKRNFLLHFCLQRW